MASGAFRICNAASCSGLVEKENFMNVNFSRRAGAAQRIKREDITMRYLKMIVCAALLLFVAGAANAQQDYFNNFAGGGPDNVPATTAPVYTPMQVAVDRNGNVYFVSQGSNYQHKAWEIVKSTGTLVNIAGGPYYGYSGDGALGPNGQLYYPIGIAVDYNGNVFIGDSDNQIIRKVNACLRQSVRRWGCKRRHYC